MEKLQKSRDMMIKAIFFDLDDTLLWDQKSVQKAFLATCKIAQERYGIDPSKLEDEVRQAARTLYLSYETYPFTQMIGINPFEGLWGEFCDKNDQFKALHDIVPTYRKDAWTQGLKALGIDDPDFGSELGETFPKERRKVPIVYKDTFPVLEQLTKDYRLLLLTNGSPDLQTTKLSLTPELPPYFEHIVISGNYGKGKPDPGIFQYALSLMSLEADEVLMVGDNLNTDILGANRTKIKSIWVNRHQKRRTDITPTFEIQNLTELFSILEKVNVKNS